ncbi:hypothetical protein PCANC_16671 [Puccinia coronata f. sp. avenae]|uniref:Uncharacterized protein n=1 Tax=Puccinia coronata f. sp. avenae TaxID=200324 RepID=A0A2N5UEN6_9BASI|nr:hypothetical protein PCANC_16671 [Puccinia coronata f. sp. avenae]
MVFSFESRRSVVSFSSVLSRPTSTLYGSVSNILPQLNSSYINWDALIAEKYDRYFHVSSSFPYIQF